MAAANIPGSTDRRTAAVPPALPRCRSSAWRLLLAGWLLLALGWAQASTAQLAIVDGPARVVDARATVEAVAGLVLDRPLILQTGAGARLLRIAFSGAGQVDLGPDSQALWLPRGLPDRARGTAVLYLLRGWAKVGAGKAGETPTLATPQLELLSAPGVAVLQVDAGRSAVFGESGNAALVERSGTRVSLPAGQFHAVAAGQAGSGAPRPPGAFMQAVPRAFRDTLPTPKLATKPAPPRELTRASHAELREWLTGEPALRRVIVTHFSAWARDPGFRAQLQRQLSEHPEWDPIVNPPPPRPASAPR